MQISSELEKELSKIRLTGARSEAEHLARLVLDAPKTKKERRSYFRQLRDNASRDTGDLAKGEAEFYHCMVCFVNA